MRSLNFFTIQQLEGFDANMPGNNATTGAYRIVFLIRGSCSFSLDSRRLTVNTESVGIVRPRHHFTIAEDVEAEGFVMAFTHDFLQRSGRTAELLQSIFLNLADADQVALPASEHRFLRDIVERLFYEYGTDGDAKEEVLVSLFQVFAIILNRATTVLNPVVQQGTCLQQTRRFFSLLDQHFERLKMPADYARLMAVSPAYLNNMIKDTLGNTTSHFIQQRIVAEAKRLMVNEALNMKEIAYRLGYLDVSHFSKFFKRITGRRFTEYKRLAAV